MKYFLKFNHDEKQQGGKSIDDQGMADQDSGEEEAVPFYPWDTENDERLDNLEAKTDKIGDNTNEMRTEVTEMRSEFTEMRSELNHLASVNDDMRRMLNMLVIRIDGITSAKRVATDPLVRNMDDELTDDQINMALDACEAEE